MSGHKLVAMTFEEASQWIASQEARIALLEETLRRTKAALAQTSPVLWRSLKTAIDAALSGARTADELAVGCHRSHPHENMDAGCQRLTEIARENNAAANMGTEARCLALRHGDPKSALR